MKNNSDLKQIQELEQWLIELDHARNEIILQIDKLKKAQKTAKESKWIFYARRKNSFIPFICPLTVNQELSHALKS